MRIQKISPASPYINFKSLRTDKKTVLQLKTGEKPLIENNKQNIYKALNNISTQPDRNNIQFLLDIADNLAYGQCGTASIFDDLSDTDRDTALQRENTSWQELLKDTIRKALNTSEDNVEDLYAEYDRIFSNEKTLTQTQIKILDLRRILTDKICNGTSVLEDAQSLSETANIRKNLDYFLASSEIPLKQKEECLEKFIYFLSDDYKINPQLKDKKNQVLDEMLNDMIIKTPESDVLTIKDVDQKYSGICAAISICRKAAAYEDKSLFTDLVLEELKDSPVMSVYDVTELGTGKKVAIPKIHIDYDTALKKGYRILDASAHNWMNNAHASGDGSIQTEVYTAFDEDNYGIYDDSSWYEGLGTDIHEEKELLKALIKEKELLESFLEEKKKIKFANSNILKAKKEALQSQAKISSALTSKINRIFPSRNDKFTADLLRELYSFYTGTNNDNEVNVPPQIPEEEKQLRIENFIAKNTPDMTCDEKQMLKDNLKTIQKLISEYARYDNNIKKLEHFNSLRGKYNYYKKLYNLAAAHRLALEADVNMPDGVVRFERMTGLPAREEQILSYMQRLKNNAKSPAVQNKFISNTGGKKDSEKLTNEIMRDMAALEFEIPAQIDSVLKSFYGKTAAELTVQMYSSLIQTVKSGDTGTIRFLAEQLGTNNDKKSVLKSLERWKSKLENSPSFEERNDAVRILGYENGMQFAAALTDSFLEKLKAGITESEYENLIKQFGGKEELSENITVQRDKFLKAMEMQDYILEKWQVPSSGTLILEKLENTGCPLSREKLDILKARFDHIQRQTDKNTAITNLKERSSANDKLLHFTEQEKEILHLIEKHVPEMKKYCKMEYQAVNKDLKDELEAQYAYIGMLNGQFWVREEGSTGLAANEQIRIMEQMTGKPYHMETDIKRAVDTIKQGKGSGIISMSVDDRDYAFHAQYIPFVSEQKIKNSERSEETQDILWMDNSWGKSEKEHYWHDENGIEHTDYGRGYGWKNGFIVSPQLLTGLPVNEFYGAVGHHSGNVLPKIDVTDINTENEDDKFGLFSDVILPGTPSSTYRKLYKMFEYIFEIQNDEAVYDALEKAVSGGAKLDIKKLSNIDDIACAKYEKICGRLDKEIKTKEDYDKLPENDELKFIMEKLALYLSTDNPESADNILEATDKKSLDEAYRQTIQVYFDEIFAIMAKSDENLPMLSEILESDLAVLFEKTAKQTQTEITNEDRQKIIEDIFFDEKAFSKLNGSLSELETYLMNKTAEAACDYLDNEKAARYFIPKMQELIENALNSNIRITSLESPALKNSPLEDEFIAIIDKYFNPESDEELLDIIKILQEADYDTVNEFAELISDEELGLDIRPAYYYVLKYKEGDGRVVRALSETVTTGIIYENIDCSKDDEECTCEELYRNLFCELSELDVQKYVKAFKAEAFEKYQVRQTFPDPVVLKDEEIEETVRNMFENLKQASAEVEAADFYINLFSSYENFLHKLSDTNLYKDITNFSKTPLTSENPEEIKLMTEMLSKIHEISVLGSDCEVFSDSVISMINKLNSENTDISCIELSSDLRALNSAFSDWISSSFSKDSFIRLKKDSIKEMRALIRFFVNTNVQKKYRDEATGKLNRLVKLYKNNADEETTAVHEEDITELVIEKHAVKNPSELLNECIEYAGEHKENTEEYEVKKLYLQTALRVARQTKIQYKLVQNQHETISSKLKDMLSMFSIVLEDGTHEKISSPEGLAYLVELLRNPNDDNTALNLFLQQSGLSQQAAAALIETFDTTNIKPLIDKKYEDFNLRLKEFNELTEQINKFMTSNAVPAKSFPKALKHLRNYIKRKFPSEDNIAAKKYIDYLDAVQFDKTHYNIAPSMISEYLDFTNEDLLEAVLEECLNRNLEYISDISGLIEERKDLIRSINISENSEAAVKRNKFYEETEHIQEYIMNILDAACSAVASDEIFSEET